mmetsp:Transcript_35210/g.101389  ORF Transcript_35210/g.101389 Transcript_35210/m.101389 type:complete len:268 (+) Transcript_35210:123-926(+)
MQCVLRRSKKPKHDEAVECCPSEHPPHAFHTGPGKLSSASPYFPSQTSDYSLRLLPQSPPRCKMLPSRKGFWTVWVQPKTKGYPLPPSQKLPSSLLKVELYQISGDDSKCSLVPAFFPMLQWRWTNSTRRNQLMWSRMQPAPTLPAKYYILPYPPLPYQQRHGAADSGMSVILPLPLRLYYCFQSLSTLPYYQRSRLDHAFWDLEHFFSRSSLVGCGSEQLGDWRRYLEEAWASGKTNTGSAKPGPATERNRWRRIQHPLPQHGGPT